MKQIRRAGLALLFLLTFASPVFSQVEIPVAILGSTAYQSGANFVFIACEVLDKNYYNPKSLDHRKLFNESLKGLAEVLKEKGIKFVPKDIESPNLAVSALKENYKKEFAKAEKLALGSTLFEEHELEFAATAFLLHAVGDSHTNFSWPKNLQEFQKSINKQVLFAGIGAGLYQLEKGFICLEWVFVGGPAYKAGFQRFDRIVAVDGEAVTASSTIESVVSELRGKKDTTVRVKVERAGKIVEAEITRDNIISPAPESSVIEAHGKKFTYLHIYRFDQDVYMLPTLLEKTLTQETEGLVIDLRDNPGGQLHVVDILLNTFLAQNIPTYTLKSRKGEEKHFIDLMLPSNVFKKDLTKLPLVILVNGGSASGSEILSGILKEQRGVKVVGEKSAGIVSVGMLIPLPFESGMMVAISGFRTANGTVLEKVGVKPDVAVELKKEDIAQGRDVQLLRAIEELEKSVDNKKVWDNMVPGLSSGH